MGEQEWGERKEDTTVVNEEIPQEEQQPGASRQCNNLVKSSNAESSDEEDDNSTCIFCKIPWIELTEKCGDWVYCNKYDQCICPKCYYRGDILTDDDDDFFL